MCEQLIADMTRKGFIDGRAARLMTVTVRPGKPNAAASSFFSGVIREPLAGVEAPCPVDASVSHPVASPARTIDALVRVFEAGRDELRGRLALNLPALNVTVQQMLDALEKVAGPKVRQRVVFRRDERIAGIVANWPQGASSARARALVQQRPGERAHAGRGQQVGRRRELVGQHQFADRLAAEVAACEQRACQARADESGAAGDQEFHRVLVR